ncbi:uncharacterized protein LOC134770416 [Penaeus indicus]|uniref:uncharacterized protein LOC134770416 n=1 Tax=Penaeus indicus TaxID=29960 RepID=UPI00300CC5F1
MLSDSKNENKEAQDVCKAKRLKDSEGQVLTEDTGKGEVEGYYQQLMNVESPRNKGDIQDCGNYRDIKLTSPVLKMWERIIDKRLWNRFDVSEQQFGFTPNRSATDVTYALRQVMEEYREGQEESHCIFIDLEKAYNRVPRQEVWNCLRLKEVEEKYIRLVQEMYEGNKTLVRCAAGDTGEFEVTVGLHQGSALNLFLFAVIINCVTGQMQREVPWDMLFADDVVVSAETKEEVEQRLELWREAIEVRGMKVTLSPFPTSALLQVLCCKCSVTSALLQVLCYKCFVASALLQVLCCKCSVASALLQFRG